MTWWCSECGWRNHFSYDRCDRIFQGAINCERLRGIECVMRWITDVEWVNEVCRGWEEDGYGADVVETDEDEDMLKRWLKTVKRKRRMRMK